MKLRLKSVAGGWGKDLVQRLTARCTEAEGGRHVRAALGVVCLAGRVCSCFFSVLCQPCPDIASAEGSKAGQTWYACLACLI